MQTPPQAIQRVPLHTQTLSLHTSSLLQSPLETHAPPTVLFFGAGGPASFVGASATDDLELGIGADAEADAASVGASPSADAAVSCAVALGTGSSDVTGGG